jgi:hypothetical protein
MLFNLVREVGITYTRVSITGQEEVVVARKRTRVHTAARAQSMQEGADGGPSGAPPSQAGVAQVMVVPSTRITLASADITAGDRRPLDRCHPWAALLPTSSY